MSYYYDYIIIHFVPGLQGENKPPLFGLETIDPIWQPRRRKEHWSEDSQNLSAVRIKIKIINKGVACETAPLLLPQLKLIVFL